MLAGKGRYNASYEQRNVQEDERAISHYDKALGASPELGPPYKNRALACYGRGEYDKTWEDVHKAESLGDQIHSGFLKALREASGRER